MSTADHDVEMMRTFVRRKRQERTEHLAARLAAARQDFQTILAMVVRDF